MLSSIITVNLNNCRGLEKTMQSVLNQTFDDFEYIVIDGGSIDGSYNLIKLNEGKIAKWISEKDSGIYHAMNKGIEMASGKYCLFLNSGDTLHQPDTLKKIFRIDQSYDIIYGNMMIHYPDGKKRVGLMPKTIDQNQMINDTLWHPVSFISRKLFEQYGYYDENYRIAGDYDFFVKVFSKCAINSKHCGIIVSDFYAGGLSYSQTNKQLLESERNAVQQKYFTPDEITKAKLIAHNRNNFSTRILNKFNQLLARLA